MNKPQELIKSNLMELWGDRYLPDLSALSSEINCFQLKELIEMSESQGRKQTVEEVNRILNIKCNLAKIKTNILFSYVPNKINLSRDRELAKYVQQVYKVILKIYEKQPPISPSKLAHIKQKIGENININSKEFEKWVMPELKLPNVTALARELQPSIDQLREQHLLENGGRTIGFTSTQFHFTTKFIFNQLKLTEQLLLSPYFKFVEEQVCIPWDKVYQATAKHGITSPELKVVQKLLPASNEIAINIHRKASEKNPYHVSRRGKLSVPGVKASSIRDIEMFQAYLWLCVLEGNMTPIKQRLLPLCVIVFPSINVKWELIEQIVPLLVEEFQLRLNLKEMKVLEPYTTAMQQLFSNPTLKQKTA